MALRRVLHRERRYHPAIAPLSYTTCASLYHKDNRAKPVNQQSNAVSEIRDRGLTNTFIFISFGKSMDSAVKCDVAVLPMLSQDCGKYAKWSWTGFSSRLVQYRCHFMCFWLLSTYSLQQRFEPRGPQNPCNPPAKLLRLLDVTSNFLGTRAPYEHHVLVKSTK